MTDYKQSQQHPDDEGVIHVDSRYFGKLPVDLIHDSSITDGACRLYAHMRWRYGGNRKNFEGRQSMADFLGVTEATITHRIRELEAADWIVVVTRGRQDDGAYKTNIYHVFENPDDARHFRATYEPRPWEKVRPKLERRQRKTRRGVGGKPTHTLDVRTADETQLTAFVGKFIDPIFDPARRNASDLATQCTQVHRDADEPTAVYSSSHGEPTAVYSSSHYLDSVLYLESESSRASARADAKTLALVERKRGGQQRAPMEAGHIRLMLPKLQTEAKRRKKQPASPKPAPRSMAEVWRDEGLSEAEIDARATAALQDALAADSARVRAAEERKALYTWVRVNFGLGAPGDDDKPNSLPGKYVGLLQKRPSKRSKARDDEWANAELERAVTAQELDLWARWYRRKMGSQTLNLYQQPLKLAASINAWIASGCPDVDSPVSALTPEIEAACAPSDGYFDRQRTAVRIFDDDGTWIGIGPDAVAELRRRRAERAAQRAGGAA